MRPTENQPKASCYRLQIPAESTQRLSDEFKDRHQETEWVKIAGLRNILAHDYPGLDTISHAIARSYPLPPPGEG
ncbi:MAG: DUF86 domain-containing protein [Proteobacteria bacterium]|nr:DUF86 domain-containing protein [Pseudomonadota bacterium]